MALLTTETGPQEAINYINDKLNKTVGHTHDGTDENGGIIKASSISFDNSIVETDCILVQDAIVDLYTGVTSALTIPKIPIRQTVLSGYCATNGKPGYISGSTGLNLLVYASSFNIIMTAAGGFNNYGQVDRIGIVSSDKIISNLFGAKTVSSLTYSGTTATCVTSTAHNLVTGIKISVVGCACNNFNGDYIITVTNSTTFTYTISAISDQVTYPPTTNNIPTEYGTGVSYKICNYIFADIASDKTVTFSVGLLEPIIQYGGSISTVNGQFTFDTLKMIGYLGNGSGYNQVWRIYLGSCICTSSTVINVALNKIGDDSSALITTNGWQKLNSGLIFQWGLYTSTSDGDQSFNFPITFPNACLGVVGSLENASRINWTTSGFIYDRDDHVDGYIPITVIAIGY